MQAVYKIENNLLDLSSLEGEAAIKNTAPADTHLQVDLYTTGVYVGVMQM